MNKRKKTKLTNEELADAYIFPVELTPAQKRYSAKKLAEARAKVQAEMTDQERISLRLHQLKLQIESYIESKKYDPSLSFGIFLIRYIDILQVKRKDFAEAISIDETLLSQLVNLHRLPPDYISIRLELHSNASIPADYWFRLIGKQKEHEIRTDESLRKKERKFVHSIAIAS